MISVMLAGRQNSALAAIRGLLSFDSEFEITAESPGGENALGKIENSSPDILIICCDGQDADAVSLAERVIMQRPRTFVVMLMREITVSMLQSVTAAGCHNISVFPSDSKELCDYIHRVYNAETSRIAAIDSNQRVTWSSKIITVFGAKGGMGKTTIATNLAVRLAECGKKVALVDLDLQFGDVCVFMDTEPKETISDLMQDMASPSIDSIRSYMCIHPSGVNILCAPKSPEYADMISGESVQELLNILKTNYDYVVVDTASNFTDPIIAALEISSTILFVTGLDISVLKNSKVAMSILESLGQKKKVRTIINRAVEINSITIADVQRIVDAPILSRIPSDYMVAVAALNQGQPFVQSAPKTKISLAICDIAEKIMSGNDSFDIQQLSPKERRKLMNKYKTRDKSEKKFFFRRRS